MSWVVAAAVLLAVCGCGSGGEPGSGAAPANKGSPGAKARGGRGAGAADNMVAAVSATKGHSRGGEVRAARAAPGRPASGYRYRPAPGSPSLERVQAIFHAGDGLDIVSGGETASIERPQEGVPIHHTIRILRSGTAFSS